MVEEMEETKSSRRGAFSGATASKVQKPQSITAIESTTEPRIFTPSAELNRVLGGGIVRGSLVLIGEIRVSESLLYFCKPLRS